MKILGTALGFWVASRVYGRRAIAVHQVEDPSVVVARCRAVGGM